MLGFLGLGVQEGGKGDILSSLLLGIKLLGPCSLFEPFTTTFSGSEWLVLKLFWIVQIVDAVLLSHSLDSHVENLVGCGGV